MANVAKTAEAKKFDRSAIKGVKESKYGVLNTMTVNQLAAAKKVLSDKLAKDKNLPEDVVAKMTEMLSEYERTERQIHRYYQRVSASPYKDSLLVADNKKYTLATLTINKIKGKTAVNGRDMGTLDRKVLTPSNALIAAGVVSTVAGGLSIKDWFLAKAIWKLLTQNKMQAILFGAGAGLIAAGIIAKKAKKYKAARLAKQAEINKVENDISEAAMKGDLAIEGMLKNGTDANIEKVANELLTNPNLIEIYSGILSTGVDSNGKQYSNAERLTIARALKKAKELEAQLDKEVKDLNKKPKTAKDPKNNENQEQKDETEQKEDLEQKDETEQNVDPNKVAEARKRLDDLVKKAEENIKLDDGKVLFGSKAEQGANATELESVLKQLSNPDTLSGKYGELDTNEVEAIKKLIEARIKELKEKNNRRTKTDTFLQAQAEAEARQQGK